MPLSCFQLPACSLARLAVLLLLVCLFPLQPVRAVEPAASSQLVYLGTYTRGGESEGIYVCRLNLSSGELTDLKLAAKTKNPSFLAIHPGGKFLYSVSEIADFDGKRTGAISAFSMSVGESATNRPTMVPLSSLMIEISWEASSSP